MLNGHELSENSHKLSDEFSSALFNYRDVSQTKCSCYKYIFSKMQAKKRLFGSACMKCCEIAKQEMESRLIVAWSGGWERGINVKWHEDLMQDMKCSTTDLWLVVAILHTVIRNY